MFFDKLSSRIIQRLRETLTHAWMYRRRHWLTYHRNHHGWRHVPHRGPLHVLGWNYGSISSHWRSSCLWPLSRETHLRCMDSSLLSKCAFCNLFLELSLTAIFSVFPCGIPAPEPCSSPLPSRFMAYETWIGLFDKKRLFIASIAASAESKLPKLTKP